MSGRHALSDLNSERQLANSPKEKAQKGLLLLLPPSENHLYRRLRCRKKRNENWRGKGGRGERRGGLNEEEISLSSIADTWLSRGGGGGGGGMRPLRDPCAQIAAARMNKFTFSAFLFLLPIFQNSSLNVHRCTSLVRTLCCKDLNLASSNAKLEKKSQTSLPPFQFALASEHRKRKERKEVEGGKRKEGGQIHFSGRSNSFSFFPSPDCIVLCCSLMY